MEIKNFHEITGDATKPQGDGKCIIAHVVNDVGKFGAGFSGALDKAFDGKPQVSYREWFNLKDHCGVEFALGESITFRVAPDIFVAHMLCQQGVGTSKRRISYTYLTLCLVRVFQSASKMNCSVHMPRIGSGLAGGDWQKIKEKIASVHEEMGCKFDVFIYTLE